jgi:hypothetical protein
MTIKLTYEDVRKLRKGTNAFDIFDFPFLENAKIAIRVLTQEEILQCLDAGRQDARDKLTSARDIDTYQFGMARLFCKAVLVVPEP